VIILAPGGIGNQLFAVATALHLAEIRKIKIRIFSDNKELTDKFTQAKSDSEFPQSVSMVYSNKINLWINIWSSRAHNLSKKFQFAKNFIEQRFFTMQTPWKFPYELLNYEVKVPWVLRGFFQDPTLVENLSEKNIDLISKILGLDSVEEIQKVMEDNYSIGVHIRRGDYYSISDYGTLAMSYFHEIISQIRTENSCLIIGSDDVEVLNAFESSASDKLLFPNAHSPLDTMIQLAKVRSFIMSNSTYSFWIAWAVSLRGGSVFAPQPWFKTSNVPENYLYLESFSKQISRFESDDVKE
jgi:Glycosyl transferase family 11